MNHQRIILLSVSLVLVSMPAVVSLVLFGGVQGYKEGLLADIDPKLLAGFSSHGPDFFEFVAEKYLFIAVCSLVFIVGRIIDRGRATLILCFLALSGIIFFYGRLLFFKYSIDDSATLLYREWLNFTLRLDWACLISTGLVIVVELIGLTRFRNEGEIRVRPAILSQ
jgi:hypothetical protein